MKKIFDGYKNSKNFPKVPNTSQLQKHSRLFPIEEFAGGLPDFSWYNISKLVKYTK
jgi:hypothetical protein